MTRAIDGTSVIRSNKTPWEGLSMAEKAALMKEAVDNGVYDLKAVRSGYDSFVKVAEPVVEEVSISEPSVTDGVPLDKLRRSLEDFYVNIESNVYAGGGNKGRQRVNPLKQQFLNTMEQALKESSSHNSAQWRKFLTDLADMESSYNANVTNNIGAKGYFQLMPFNRARSWSSPTQQFHEMFKLTDGNLDYFKKNLTKEDWAKADRMGIDIYGLLAGAHLGGVKGALNALRGKSNAKDSNGTSVMHYMKKFSQHPSRDSIFSNLKRQLTDLRSQAADFVMRHSNSDISELQENIFNTDNTDGSWHVPMMLPSNPTVFSNLMQFTQPSWSIPQRPDISEVFKAYDESKKQEELAEKQAERQQHMNNMRFFMNLMDYGKPKGDGSSFMSTIGMLAGNGMNNNPYSLDSKGNGGNSKGSELTLMPMFGNMYAGGDKIERRKGVKGGEPVEYYDASEVMPIVADNMGKSIVLDEVEVTPSRRLPIQDALFEGITNQAANERADEYTNKTSLTPGRFLGLMGANVPLAAGALGATVAAPAFFDSTIAPLSDYVAGTKAGQAITGLLSNPYFNTAVEAGFAGHGLNHAVNEGVDGWGDAAMTALEITPLGRLAKPVYNTGIELSKKYPALYQYPRYAVGKFKYGFNAQLPTLYRKVKTLPKIEDGRVVVSNPNSRFAFDNGYGEDSPIITNFTTDAPVRSHSSGNWDRGLTLAFPGRTLLGKHVISTRPSDTFTFGDNITVPTSNVTAFTGRPKEITFLQNAGIKTISSPEAEVFWESGASDLANQAAKVRATNAKIFSKRGNGVVLLKPKTPVENFDNYTTTIENLTRETFKSPTAKDYQFMDYVFKPLYKSETVPKVDNFTMQFLTENPTFGEWLGNSERRRYLEEPWRWEYLMYDPLTTAESEFRNNLNIGLKPEFKK